jgi:capsular exopolysaccharide synthesis family protein
MRMRALPTRIDGEGAPHPVAYDAAFARGAHGPMGEDQDEAAIDLQRLLGAMRRNVWIVIACVAACGALGWIATKRAVPRYEAAASLRITNDEGGVPGLEALSQIGGGGNEVNTELEVLRSRTLAGAVVDQHDLRLAVMTPTKTLRGDVLSRLVVSDSARVGRYRLHRAGREITVIGPDSLTVRAPIGETAVIGGMSLTPTADAAMAGDVVLEVQSREEAITTLVEALQVARPSRDANILVVRYRGTDPTLVQAVPNALVQAFVSRRVGTRKTGARSTVEFLRGQLDTLQGEMRASEDSLQHFREAERVVSIEQQASVSVGKLAELQADRNQAAAELAAIEATLAEARARSQVAGSPSPYRRLLAFPTLLRNPVISTLLQSVTTLENERATLLVRRTDRDPDVAALTGQIAAVEGQIAGVVVTYTDGLRQQVVAFDRSLAQSGAQLDKIPAKEIRLAQLLRSTTVLTELSTLLQTRLKEAEISEAVEDPSAQVVDFAERPVVAVSPRPALNLALATLLGLLLGGGIAVGREVLDRKVHNREELVQAAGGLPVLGVIPHFTTPRPRSLPSEPQRRKEDRATALVAREDPQANVLEAYRALRTSLAFAGVEQTPKLVVVTSPTAGDGKSTSTVNLAASLAQQHLRVLVIDADMRRGSLHRTLGGARTPGLSEILTGQVNPLSTIQSLAFDGVGQVDLISTGTIPPNPSELLGSARMPDLFELLEPRYDTILIDTPPVNIVADVLVLARHADGVVLVTRGGTTERGAIRFALEQLESVHATVLGTVLNDYDVHRAASYGGEYYRHYYGSGYGERA